MANTDSPRGFRPVDNQFGGEYTGRRIKVAFDAADATPAFNGSLVKFTGASLEDGKIPVVTLASPADVRIAGAIMDFEPERDGDWTAEVGDTVRGFSTMELDSSTAANTATLPLRLHSVVEVEKNSGSSTDSNATWIVSINQVAELDTTGSN